MSGQPIASALTTTSTEQTSERAAALFDFHHQRLYRLVSVQLLPDGAQRMRQATAAHVGRPMAILIDGEVVTAPTVRSAVSDSAWINSDYTQAEAQRIADGIGVR